MSKSSRTVLRQLSHMAFRKEDLEAVFHKGKSIAEIRSSSIMETAGMRGKSVDVPRCQSCREGLGETTIAQYSGGPRKETADNKAQERSAIVACFYSGEVFYSSIAHHASVSWCT